MQEVRGSSPTQGGLRVSQLQASEGISTLQSRAPGLQSTTQGNSVRTKRLLRVKTKKALCHTCRARHLPYQHLMLRLDDPVIKGLRPPEHHAGKFGQDQKTPPSQNKRDAIWKFRSHQTSHLIGVSRFTSSRSHHPLLRL